MKEKCLPIVAVTMGDPAGIGPEICLKALTERTVNQICIPVLIGFLSPLRQAAELLGMEIPLKVIDRPEQARFEKEALCVIEPKRMSREQPTEIGVLSKEGGEAAYLCVEKAIALAMAGEVAATVTAPINKEALHMAGYSYAGHTEIYAALTGSERYAMLLMHDRLRVVHVSTHVSLRDACDAVKKTRVLEVIRLAAEALSRMGIEQPRIAVAGLNPHAGENGLFGEEEAEEIAPAIARANAEGIIALGPFPPDTVFAKAAAGHYDAVIAMYHDQGHIALKMLGFDYQGKQGRISGINVTLGLPIIRVSVDHGTAFDIAGKGCASQQSLLEAVLCAAQMSKRK